MRFLPFAGVRKISHVSTKSFYSLLEFIVDVVLATTYTLVDRVWYLFVDVFARYIADHAQTIGTHLSSPNRTFKKY